MSKVSLNPKEVLSGKRTFYAKKWQNNGYYPVFKFVFNEEENAWEEFCPKGNGWRSWGCAYAKPVVINGQEITNRSWWEYIFENNLYILSYEKMKDRDNFNNE